MNSKIIEIVGPPGIGKSTIYDALCKTWDAGDNWIYQEALLAPKPQFSSLNRWVHYRFRRLLGKKISKTIPVEFGLRFADNYQELANFYWNHLSNPEVYNNREVSMRFRSAYFLFSDFCRYQAIQESTGSKPCFINEGLIQKSFLIHEDESFMQDVVNKYITLLPKPYAIIHIDTPDRNIIAERLGSRKKVIATQAGKDRKELLKDIERWQSLLGTILEKMRAKGVIVYPVNAEKPVEENVSLIKKKLSDRKISTLNPMAVD